jgi:RHH-type proline utilization regulon transcriptional repressor/proline dehydrogenase/delta 1-pyrroline-5-carboxylate dehydrogenase
VNRQPFGGWKRSSVGPNAKAGGENYLATLRNWKKLQHFLPMKEQALRWWKSIGSQSIDRAGLVTEANLQRYRSYSKGFLVRIDSGNSKDEISYLEWLRNNLSVKIVYSSPDLINGLTNVIVESVDEFVERANEVDRVRWLSIEPAPTYQLLKNGITCDPRAIAQRGDIELSRWFLEQSVAITQHRYGNVNAGPKPRALGLAS